MDKWLGMLNSFGEDGVQWRRTGCGIESQGKPLGPCMRGFRPLIIKHQEPVLKMQAFPAGDESLITLKCFA